MVKEKVEAVTIGTKVQQARAHIQKHKQTYLAAAGASIVTALIMRRPVQIVNVVSPEFKLVEVSREIHAI
jgi:hypothetical protein